MKKWEYKTFNDNISEWGLNKLGIEGWELSSHTAIYVSKTHKISQHYIFKREIL